MQRIWILAADSTRARLFERSTADEPVREIQDFLNPAGRAHDRDLRSDAEGRYAGKQGRQAHTAPRHTDAAEHEAEQFSKRVSDFLDHERTQNRFERLYLIGPPHFLGLLRRKLSKQAQQLVAAEIAKDVSRSGAKEIEQLVREKSERPAL